MKHSHPLTARPVLAAGIVLISFTLVLAACAPYGAAAQGSNGNTPAAPTSAVASATPMASAAGNGDVQLANDPKFGQILVTASGLTLYTFEIDKPGVSNCQSSDCVKYWPPYLASGQPMAAAGITGKLSLITRPDGTQQVTYNDMPLYTFIADKKPGDITGDGINQFGGVWHVAVVGK